jgi:tRNA pseudouridine13 synthase
LEFAPAVSAKLKVALTDFKVEENLGFEPTSSGEHIFLKVKKINLSTLDVARKISEITGLKMSSIGYSGMKDKRGECVQWFSIPFQEELENLIGSLENDQLMVITKRLNTRKLRIGSHKENNFRIKLRDCRGEKSEFERRLYRMMEQGIPNYFGVQRFGKHMNNIRTVMNLARERPNLLTPDFSKKRMAKSVINKGILISAARSYMFNQVLSTRIKSGNWNEYVPGDVINLDGTDSYFLVANDQWDDTLEERLNNLDIHISGPLAGIIAQEYKYVTKSKAADIEGVWLMKFRPLLKKLIEMNVLASRRPMRFRPKDLRWSWEGDDILDLSFSLRRGCYATSLLREVCLID